MSKYRNVHTTASDGTIFASKRECNRYEELLLLHRMGKITKPEIQVSYELIPKQAGERACNYVADFVYRDEPVTLSSKPHVEDTKGFRTKDYIIKRKLMLYIHGITIEEV